MPMLRRERRPTNSLTPLCAEGSEEPLTACGEPAALLPAAGLTCSWSGPKPGVAAAAAAMVVGIS